MKKVNAIIEVGKDGSYSIYLDDHTLEYGVFGEGNTVAEAKADLEASYEGMKELYKEEGRQFTEVEFTYQYDAATVLQYYAQFLTLVGLAKMTGINKCQLSHYINGTSRPGARTVQKLQEGFVRLGREFSSIQLC